MVNVNDFKVGMTIQQDGNLYIILDFQHDKPGKGAAIVKAKLKNLRTGSIAEYSFNAGVKVETARIEKKPMQFMYTMNDLYYFMNMKDYEQIELPKSILGDDCKLLKANLDVDIMFFEQEMLGMTLPDKIAMKVTYTEPGVKGNTTSTATKDATLESGLVVKVPMFMAEGEMVLISSKDRKYVSRA